MAKANNPLVNSETPSQFAYIVQLLQRARQHEACDDDSDDG